jgi:hypothetical protein
MMEKIDNAIAGRFVYKVEAIIIFDKIFHFVDHLYKIDGKCKVP